MKSTDDQARGSTARAWSITTRLTALFTISTSILVFVVVAILYEAIARHLDEEHEHLLSEIVRVLQHSAGSPGRSVASLVEQVRAVESSEPASYSDPYAVRVVDLKGRVLAENREIANVPVDAFRAISPVLPGRNAQPNRWTAANGESYLIAKIATSEPSGPASSAFVHVALNVTRDRELMGQLRGTAIALVLVALLAAAIAGSAVVRYSLRPLGRITSEVAEISAKSLGRQLTIADRPLELHPLVRAFNTTLDRLERAFAGLSEYSENLAHELRTPLNNLKGEAEVALLHERSPAEYREVLMSSLEEYNRLATMAEGLLFLARAESRETKPAWAVRQLGQEAEAVCELYEGVAEEKRATLTVQGDAAVSVDPVLFRRALGNLVSNALAHIRPAGQVRIAITTEDGGAAVRVIDNGSGIAVADLPHVFDRFYRSTETRSSGIQGSGLGLAIVKSVMDLHGGSVEISSTPGQGTTVTLHLPATPD